MQREKPMQPEATSGRDFLKVVRDLKSNQDAAKEPFDPEKENLHGAFSFERVDAMHVGDYIKMPVKEFKSWVGTTEGDQNALNESSSIKVEIIEIIPAADNTSSLKLKVKAGDVTKEIDGSLVYNYGKRFTH
jgi:hypothetical protein